MNRQSTLLEAIEQLRIARHNYMHADLLGGPKSDLDYWAKKIDFWYSVLNILSLVEKMEKDLNKTQAQLKVTAQLSFGHPNFMGPVIVKFCGLPLEEAVERVQDYSKLKKKLEEVEKEINLWRGIMKEKGIEVKVKIKKDG